MLETRSRSCHDIWHAGVARACSRYVGNHVRRKGRWARCAAGRCPKRISVIDISVGENEEEKFVIINPEIIVREGSQTGEEGCLSIPGFREPVTRANKVRVRAQEGRR